MNRLPRAVIVLLGACGSGRAAEPIQLAKTPYVLPYGKTAQFSFDVPADADAVRLTVELRMDFPRPAGSTYVLLMTLGFAYVAYTRLRVLQ